MENKRKGSSPEIEQGRQIIEGLPFDLCEEILIDVPIRSLLRFKCVSKFWYHLITSSDFILKYYSHNKDSDRKKNQISIFCRISVCNASSTTVPFSFSGVPTDLRIPVSLDRVDVVGCSNGVICLSLSQWLQGWHKGLALWNPATKQFRLIDGNYPSTYGREQHYSCGFCFDPIADSFKVARIAISEKTAQINIYASKPSSWRLEELTLHKMCDSTVTFCTLSVGTFMYWKGTVSCNGDACILCFDMVEESFCYIQLPYSGFPYFEIAEYKDTIALFVLGRTGLHCPFNYFDVWVMIDRQGINESWSKLIMCRPSVNVVYARGFLFQDGVYSTVVRNCLDEDFSVNPKTGETKKLLGVGRGSHEFHLFSESFASVY